MGMPDRTYCGVATIVGKPNTGKSTLLNALLGVKVAPISSKPQTTRLRLRGVWTEEDRQLVFVDTPGMHDPRDLLGRWMVQQIEFALDGVDLVLWVVDLSRSPGEEDKLTVQAIRRSAAPVILVGNKADLAGDPGKALEAYRELEPSVAEAVAVSALEGGRELAALRAGLLARIPEGPFLFPEDIRSDQYREVWAAEIVREVAMEAVREELPYALAVQVTEWIDRDDLVEIHAEVVVDKLNHRPMLIGKGGRMIKRIGQAARKRLEVLLARRVFLGLEVVVRDKWRNDPEALRELGYQ